jgi:predicted DsbA family dithiol-disulfide isomerase
VDRRQSYVNRLGDEGAQDLFDRIAKAGREVQIDFSFGGRLGNSRASHRLVHCAGRKGFETQDKLVEGLFKANFEDNKNIADESVLIDTASRAGIDGEEARRWLSDEAAGKEVDEQANEARQNGITGVPNFMLNDRFEISGAQQSIAFVRLFERLVKIEQRSRV